MKRKLVSSLLIISVFAAMLSACGTTSTPAAPATTAEAPAETNTEAEATEAPEQQASEGVGITGSMTYDMFIRGQYALWIQDLKWYDVAEERTGVHVNYIQGPEEFDDTYAEVDQRVTSHTLADANMCKLSQAKVYGMQGAFLDITPYLDKYAPDLKKFMDENPDYTNYITADDGGVYAILQERPTPSDFIGYRADHFEKAGVDASTVQTVEDLTEAMRVLKAHYGEENPSYYPLTGRDSPFRFGAWFGANAYVDEEGGHGVYYTHEKDGSYDIKADGAYEMIETMRTWYEEGLINPQFVAGTFSEGDWEQAMITGDGSIVYDNYTRPSWFMLNGGPDSDPDYQIAILDYLKDKDGNILKVAVNPRWQDMNATAISSDCDEDTIATILGFINYFYTEEGKTLASWGVEGETFEVDENGDKNFMPGLYEEQESIPDGNKKWSFIGDRLTVARCIDNEAFYAWNDDMTAEACERLQTEEWQKPAVTLNYTTEQAEELASLVAAVFDAQTAGLVKFVDGSVELNESNWNSFIDEMDALGLARIEEIEAEAYNATYAE